MSTGWPRHRAKDRIWQSQCCGRNLKELGATGSCAMPPKKPEGGGGGATPHHNRTWKLQPPPPAKHNCLQPTYVTLPIHGREILLVDIEVCTLPSRAPCPSMGRSTLRSHWRSKAQSRSLTRHSPPARSPLRIEFPSPTSSESHLQYGRVHMRHEISHSLCCEEHTVLHSKVHAQHTRKTTTHTHTDVCCMSCYLYPSHASRIMCGGIARGLSALGAGTTSDYSITSEISGNLEVRSGALLVLSAVTSASGALFINGSLSLNGNIEIWVTSVGTGTITLMRWTEANCTDITSQVTLDNCTSCTVSVVASDPSESCYLQVVITTCFPIAACPLHAVSLSFPSPLPPHPLSHFRPCSPVFPLPPPPRFPRSPHVPLSPPPRFPLFPPGFLPDLARLIF